MRNRVLLFLMALFLVLVGCQQKPAGDAEKKAETPAGEKAEGGEEKAGEEKAGEEKPADESAKAEEKAGEEKPADDSAAPAADDAAPADAAAVAPLPGGANPFLGLIPADTPYAWVTVSTMPWEKLPFQMEAFGALWDIFSAELAKDDSPPAKLAAAIFEEFKGNLTKEGMAKLGFAVEGHMAIYGVGAFPVMRMQLANGEAFEAMIARIEGKVGFAAEKKDFNGTSYRAWNLDEATIAAAIKGNELIITLFHGKAEAFVMPYAFGDKKPEQSVLDSGSIAKLAQTYGSGDAIQVAFVDLLNITQVLTGKAQNILSESLTTYGITLPVVDGDCATEYEMLTKGAPRLVFASGMGGEEMTMNVVLELGDTEFAKGLRGLPASVPGLGTKPAGMPLAVLGLGVDVKKTIDFLIATGNGMKAAPFKCDHLVDLNEMATGVDALSAPGVVPPFVAGLKGFNIVLENLDMAGGMPSNIKALALLKTESPAELWAQVQPLLGPSFASVSLTANADPAALPAIPGAPMIEAPHIYMSDDAIALSIGADQAANLAGFAKAEAPAKAPLFVLGYDLNRFMGLMNSAIPAGGDEKAMFEAMAGAYKAFGMGMAHLSITEQGLELTYVLTFSK